METKGLNLDITNKKETLKNTYSKSKLIQELKDRYGKWTVLFEVKKRGSSIYIKCRCDCGLEKYILFYDLLRGKSTCCGSCSITERNIRHGQNRHENITYEYRLWQNLKHNKLLSKDWHDSFQLFFHDMGERPDKSYYILRKNYAMKHSIWNSFWGSKKLKKYDLEKIGKKYGSWTILEPDLITVGKTRWKVRCDCGVVDYVCKYPLENGITTKCRKCAGGGRKTKHGMSRSSEYIAYNNMIKRCYNHKDKSFCYYGAKGVAVCDRWLESFVNFFEDMGRKPSKNHSLDRINVNGNYEKDNCRWVLQKVQAANKR